MRSYDLCAPINRVRTHFSRSNSSTFQALLRVIFKIFQNLFAGVKYESTGIYIYTRDFFLSQLCTLYCAVKHLKLCFIMAKTKRN